jgi:uncharacterized protein (TIGR03437 family)
MKYFALILLVSGTIFAQDYLTGQSARITIGQVTFTSQDNLAPSQYQLGAVGGLAYVNNTLFVVDSNHIQAFPVDNRVLIYNDISRFMISPTAEIPQGTRCPLCIGLPEVGGANVVVGEPDFVTTEPQGNLADRVTQNGLRTPTAVASNGTVMVIADTDNDRVLIWNRIPTSNFANADVVLGQPDFVTFNPPTSVTASSLRGPQGVWIQGTQLFVADTGNSRILVWNTIPTANNQPADYALGEPNLTTAPPITTLDITPAANNLFNPVSVTSDGQRLYVADLGHSRVLIWNTIPTTNGQAADVVIGQPDMVSEAADAENNVLGTCVTNGTDTDGNPTYPSGCTAVCPVVPNGTDSDGYPTYPARCNKTLNLPRYALSDGQRLYIADGGNDRVMVYETIPTQNGVAADVILGQPDDVSDVVAGDTTATTPGVNVLMSAPNTIRTPLSLAWDGANLYVADPYDDRVLAFTPGTSNVPVNGILNAASLTVYAVGTIEFAGTVTAKDTLTITFTNTNVSPNTTNSYPYTVLSTDTLPTIIQAFVSEINGTTNGAPDPNVIATPDIAADALIVTARVSGPDGDNINYTTAVSSGATETLTPVGTGLSGGQNPSEVAPSTLVTITGTDLSDNTVSGVPDSHGYYPSSLGGVQVYFDGIAAPLLYVSPTQINTQIPYEVNGSNGLSSFVRTVHNDGSVTATTAIAVPVVPENPGLFAEPGNDPRVAIAYHYSSRAIGLVSVDGTIDADDTGTVSIQGRPYTYTVQSTDTLATIRDGLIALINSNSAEQVIATPSGEFTRILLTAKVSGPEGNGIGISVTNTGTGLILTTLNTQTCCANVAGARLTADNPAVPNEIIALYATGIGLVTLGDGTNPVGATGQIYTGPEMNVAETAVDNAQVGTTTANVVNAFLKPGLIGVYEVDIQIPATQATDPSAQLFIAQNIFTSNIVLIPVTSPTNAATPTVTSVTPNTGPAAGGTAVTIKGTNFASGATATFGGVSATNVVVVNNTTITCTTPAGTKGSAVNVTVTVLGVTGTLSSGFTYN